MMRRAVNLALLILQAACLYSYGQPARPAETLALIDQARSLPAEFRADTLLRIASSSLITDVSWKRELIEDAYWSGAHAPLPYAQNANERSDSVTVNSVRANRMEALSLQSRAVEAMVAIDEAKGLNLFEQIAPVNLPKLNCSSPVTPNLVEYYQAALEVFQKSFSPKQRANGDDFHFLQRLVADVGSPAQIPPVVEMLFASEQGLARRRELFTLLATKLQEISRSDREYGAAESGLRTVLVYLKAEDASVLFPDLRSYIVRHVSAKQCSDYLLPKTAMRVSVNEYNREAKKFDPEGSRYKLISFEEAKPAGDAGTYPENLFGRSTASQAITEEIRWLVHNAEPSHKNWRARYDETSKLVHDLKEDDENSPEAFFCMKSDALNHLAVLPSPGPARDSAMDDYREFLEEYYSSIQNSNLWFTMFRHMLYTARFADDPDTKTWILNELMMSSNPVMSLYAKLEKLCPPRKIFSPHRLQ